MKEPKLTSMWIETIKDWHNSGMHVKDIVRNLVESRDFFYDCGLDYVKDSILINVPFIQRVLSEHQATYKRQKVSFSIIDGSEKGEIIVTWFSVKVEKSPDEEGKPNIVFTTNGRKYSDKLDVEKASVTVEIDTENKLKNIKIDLRIKQNIDKLKDVPGPW